MNEASQKETKTASSLGWLSRNGELLVNRKDFVGQYAGWHGLRCGYFTTFPLPHESAPFADPLLHHRSLDTLGRSGEG